MVKIVPSHPYLVANYQDIIIGSLNDQDISIRMRALDLVSAMVGLNLCNLPNIYLSQVDQNNLQSIVQQVLAHLVQDPSSAPLSSAVESLSAQSSTISSAIIPPNQNPSYRLVLSRKILEMGSRNTYDNVVDFEWYLSVLVDLAHVANVDVGGEIRDQLVDLVGRVRDLREYAVRLMFGILNDDSWLHAGESGRCSEVLWAAAWICGEYSA
jgi:AP-3 complex subunit delta-1